MYAIHRILVAIRDPAAKSQPALDKAAALASLLDADVQLFHDLAEEVYANMWGDAGAEIQTLEQDRREEYRQLLEKLAKPLRRRELRVTTAVEWDFPPHEAIVRNAMQFGADLVIAAGHATHHRMPWLLRYTDWELLRCCPMPVLLVKNPRPWRRPAVLAAVDPTHAFAKPSGLDREILRYGATLAEALKGRVHAVHAYPPVPLGMTPRELSVPGATEQAMARLETRAMQLLKDETEPFRIPRRQLHVVGRHPSDAILDTAREQTAQIVVLGSISRSGLDRLVIGNTAESLIDQLDCDVMVVKPPYFHHGIDRTVRGARVVTMAPVSRIP